MGSRDRLDNRRVLIRLGMVGVLLGLVGTLVPSVARAQEPESDAEQALVERFAPILKLKEQEEDCDTDGEPYRPGPVDILLGNPEIALRQRTLGDPVVQYGPTAADLFGLGEGFFLDFPGSSLEPGCIYERDFWKYTGDRPAAVYAHIVHPPGDLDHLVVQYWFYWYYNDWNNKHESDWEGIALLFETGSVEEALESTPVAVGYSQHEGAERAEWDDDKLEREGDRPVVYSSAGSHASYFDSAVFLGRSASEGFGCDDTTGPSRRVDPEVILLPDTVDDADHPLAWLTFDGRWGERQSGAFNGPTGPAVKDRWLDPMPWFDELRSSSVIVPAGDSEASGIVDVFCTVVERGSASLISLKLSPGQTLLTAVIGFLIVRWLVGRTVWDRIDPMPIRRRRRAGQIIRAAGATYRSAPLVFLAFGVVYLPAAVIAGLLAALARFVPVLGSFLDLSSGAAGTSLVLAALSGSVANLAAFVVVNSLVASYLDGTEQGWAGARAAGARVRERLGAVLGAFLRSFLIVAGLFFVVIGIPWGIRQLVRYQFLSQAVMLDDEQGAGALDRSSDLVRGRWWHTALIVAVTNGLVGLTAVVLGLLLLVVASGIPLWVLSGILTLVFTFLIPLAAIVMTLLYGDAVAQAVEGEDDRVATALPVS